MMIRKISGKSVTHPDRTRRCKEAVERQAVRDKRTAKEQLAILKKRIGTSVRETTRLLKEDVLP